MAVDHQEIALPFYAEKYGEPRTPIPYPEVRSRDDGLDRFPYEPYPLMASLIGLDQPVQVGITGDTADLLMLAGSSGETAKNHSVSHFAGPNHQRHSDYDSQSTAKDRGPSSGQTMEEVEIPSSQKKGKKGKGGKKLKINQQLAKEFETTDELTRDVKLIPHGVEKDENEVVRESTSNVLRKQRAPTSEEASSPTAPEKQGGIRAAVLSELGIIPGEESRSVPSNRKHDIELATEISTALLEQVRNLRVLLNEKADELRDAKVKNLELEDVVESYIQRIKALDKSETRYKDECWNLETQVYELLATQKEAADREKKLTQGISILQSEEKSTQHKLDEMKQSHSKLMEDLVAEKAEHDSTRKRLEAIRKEAHSLHEEIASNEENLEDFRAAVTNKTQEIKRLKVQLADNELQKLRAEIERKDQEIQDLRSQISKKDQEISQLKDGSADESSRRGALNWLPTWGGGK